MSVGRAYGGLWVATAAGALLAVLGVVVHPVAAPYDALQHTVITAAGIARINLAVVLWPIALAAIGWHQHRGTRLVGDVLVAAQLLGHGLLVGSALGQHAAMWRFLPHLPVEWLAIALGAAGWITARADTARPPCQRLLGLALLAGLATVVAAAIETWAVPL